MYVHLGNNFTVPLKNIIAILNIFPTLSKDVKDIIEIAKIEKKLIDVSEKGGKCKTKTLVICDDMLYLSPISSITLYRRAFNRYGGGLDFEQ
ncbi:MAG: DUF370 domain-containing protein [Syntrophomonadaceae bacterium]|nr:DUF370 domain-containing protein [Syntrophomonadaceae bacterium]